NEESVKLLKKIVEMEIEEFPSHIIEKIKNRRGTHHQDSHQILYI
ncbi:hypothetical protein Gotur_023015, partial [Gossypium turneri]